mgnify:CR=1 FL=1
MATENTDMPMIKEPLINYVIARSEATWQSPTD